VRQLIASPALWIALLTLALYLPSSARVVQLSPDMVEYVDIARRLVDGEGYRLGIKAYFVGGTEVVTDGLLHRPPLLTVAIAALSWLGLDLRAVQAVHSLVGAIAAALVCSIRALLFGKRIGIAAGILAATNPVASTVQIPLMTEALSTLLTLALVRLLVGTVDRPAVWPFALAGVAVGFGYLARPPVLLLGLVAAGVTILVTSDRRRLIKPLLAMGAGAALVVVPMTLFSLVTRGRLIYLGKTYLYAVRSDRDVIEDGFFVQLSTPAEFIPANLHFIVETVASLALTYVRWLFLDPAWLPPLLPAWPLAFLALVRGRYRRAVWIALAVAIANYLFYSLTWASWQDRFLLPTLLLLLPFGVDGLFRAIERLLAVLASTFQRPNVRAISSTYLGCAFVVAVALAWLPRLVEQHQGEFSYLDRPTGTRVDAGLLWTGPPRWINDDDLAGVVTWTLARTERDAVLAAGQPWPVSLFTGRPTVLIPHNLNEDDLRRFIDQYRVAYFLADGRDRTRRDYRTFLENMAEEGVRPTRIGAVTAFETRALWR